ncbi:methyl-accepting chemotaxis protein [Bradyrhizobium sp. CCBAU 11445]|uniref:methyl-accepting chemotaxis protein n=1 Tax=Bradyrhizobium sp. CCBAU 11445 TaxID=1630896 RepID=UPI002306A87A|nr:methyl-accepting chemotaxis protein [Bradyrhizobium sp. CCBAU 11445]
MAEAVEMFKLKAREKARAELDAKVEQDHAAAAQRRADIARLAGEFEAAVGKIIDSVSSASSELEASARSLTCSADHRRQLSVEVVSSSEEASSNVRHVADATSEMAEAMTSICQRVKEAANIAHQGVCKVELSDQRMASLTAAAERIGSVVEVIAAVARQINLLALNATIEAARAGAFGRGFVVVAQEVKSLAAQAAQGTVEISEHIGGIQTATAESVGAVAEIGVIIGRISGIARTVVDAIGDQEATSKRIAFNVQGAAARTTGVAASAYKVTDGANETGAASRQVLTSAELLSEESSRLKHELRSFLAKVQTA